MEFVTLPVPMLDCAEYHGLKALEKQFLIDLYILFGDAECFTVDVERPQDYRQRQCEDYTMARRLRALVSAGLLSMTLTPRARGGHPEKIYTFTYKGQ